MVLRRSVLLTAPWLLLAPASTAFAKLETELQATSLLGRPLFALPDADGAVSAARSKLAADPKDVSLALQLSKAYAAKRQYREAVAVCTTALVTAPNSADLYTERGHRELGLREFKRAHADLSRAVDLDPRELDAHYHLGLAHYFLRQFDKAAQAFAAALALAKTADSLIDCSNWCYVALRRSGHPAEAAAVLARITPEVKNTEPHLFFYLQLLHFYQGTLTEAQVVPPRPAGADDLEHELSFNTINYGVGNWFLYNDADRTRAIPFFKNAISGFAWNSWGFVASEIELSE